MSKKNQWLFASLVMLTAQSVPHSAFGAVIPVSNSSELISAMSTATAADTIQFSAEIVLTNQMPPINASYTIDGQNFLLSGDLTYSGFFVQSGSLTVQNLTIANMTSIGGAGGDSIGAGAGGGGAAAGGGLYVHTGAAATLDGIVFVNCSSIGGAGGQGAEFNGFFTGNDFTPGGGTPGFGGGGGGGFQYGGSGGSVSGFGGGGGGGYNAGISSTGTTGIGGDGGSDQSSSGEGTGGTPGNPGTPGTSPFAGGGGGGNTTGAASCGAGGAGAEFGGGGGAGGGGPAGGACVVPCSEGRAGGFGAGSGGAGGWDSNQIATNIILCGANTDIAVNNFLAGGQGGGEELLSGSGGEGGYLLVPLANMVAYPFPYTIYGGGGGGGAAFGGAIAVAPGGTLTYTPSAFGGFRACQVIGGAGGNGGSLSVGGDDAGSAGQSYGSGLFAGAGSSITIDLTGSLPNRAAAFYDSIYCDTSMLITGSGSLLMYGSSNYFAEGLSITHGAEVTLLAENPLVIPQDFTMTLDGGVLKVTGLGLQFGWVTNLGSGGGTIDVAYNVVGAGDFLGNGTLTVRGKAGTLQLLGVDYPLVADLVITDEATVALTSNLNLYMNAITLSDGTLSMAVPLSLANPFTIDGLGTISVATGNTLFLSGTFAGTSSDVLTVTGGGIIDFQGSSIGDITLRINTSGDTTYLSGASSTGDVTIIAHSHAATPAPHGEPFTGLSMTNNGRLTLEEPLSTASPTTRVALSAEFVNSEGGLLDATLRPEHFVDVSGLSDLELKAIAPLMTVGTTYTSTGREEFSIRNGVVAANTSRVVAYAPTIVSYSDPKVYDAVGNLIASNYSVMGDPLLVLTITDQSVLPASIAQHPNPEHVLDYLRSLTYFPGTDLIYTINDLGHLEGSTLDSALDQLQPSLFGAFDLVNANTSNQIASIFARRVSPSCCVWLPNHCGCHNISWWIQPFGAFYEQSKMSNQVGFRSQTGGFVTGLNFCMYQDIDFGVGGGYASSNVYWKEHRGRGDMTTGFLGLYANYTPSQFFITSSVIGSVDDFSANRHIEYHHIDRHAKHSNRGADFTAHLGAGGQIKGGKIDWTPFVSVEYYYLHEQSFKEHGADSLNLHVRDRNSNMLRSEIGFSAGHSFKMGKQGCFTPKFSLSGINEAFLGQNYYLSGFEGEPRDLKTKTLSTPIYLASPAVDLDFFLGNGLTLTAHYSAELNGDITSQKLDGRIEWRF